MSDALELCFARCKKLRDDGAAWGAVVALGEHICGRELSFDATKTVAGHTALRKRIEAALGSATISAAIADAQSTWQRAMRVASTGSEWCLDELVLLITLRVELEFALAVFESLAVEATGVDLSLLDARLRVIAGPVANRGEFCAALGMVKRNWGIRVHDRWSPVC